MIVKIRRGLPRPARLVVDGLDEHRSATQNGDLLLFPADDGGLAGNVLPAGAGGADSTSDPGVLPATAGRAWRRSRP